MPNFYLLITLPICSEFVSVLFFNVFLMKYLYPFRIPRFIRSDFIKSYLLHLSFFAEDTDLSKCKKPSPDAVERLTKLLPNAGLGKRDSNGKNGLQTYSLDKYLQTFQCRSVIP